MGEFTDPMTPTSSSSSSFSSSPTSPSSTLPSSPAPRQQTLLNPPSFTKKKKSNVFKVMRAVFRSFPILASSTKCKIPIIHPSLGLPDTHLNNTTKVTGTLFGYRKGRISLSIQENPNFLPSLIIELAMQTTTFQKELSTGMMRIAFETEKQPKVNKTDQNSKIGILEEPLWTMFCKGEKSGYGVKREANEEDLEVMELLRPVSMGAGVLPGNYEEEGADGEIAYVRAYFERVVGTKDSETFYMVSPEGNNGPELSFFFVRV